MSIAAWAVVASSVLEYLRGYQLGFDYTQSGGDSILFYDAGVPAEGVPKGCEADAKLSGLMHCKAVLSSDETRAYGVFLEQTFKRQGWLYFKSDVRFAYFGLVAAYVRDEQPLASASIHVHGLTTEGYLKLGVTPPYVPDVLFSIGLGAQAGMGHITVEGVRQKVQLVVPHLYSQLELVWVRAGRMALASYAQVEADAGKQAVTKDYAVALSSAQIGIVKLVLPLP
jgi:hypothetical protein